MRLYGLVGYPLTHSFSKRYFTKKFEKEGIKDAFYELFPLENIHEFPSLVLDKGLILKGLNVTIPYKQQVIPFLDELDETAAAIEAVNTILIGDGKLRGYNTDVIGFEKTLENSTGLSKSGGSALVLGTGGASQAVQYVLNKRGIPFQLISRMSSENSRSYLELKGENLADYQIIINTTPLGMSPQTDACPDLDYEAIRPHHILIDLVYNPETTLFLARGKAKGATIYNGLKMLYEQAEAAWKIWNEVD